MAHADQQSFDCEAHRIKT